MGNSGHVYIGTGATLSLTSQPLGITDAVAGSQFDLYGTFSAGSGNGFASLNSIEGAVNLFGQSFTDTPGSGTLTVSSTGQLTANNGTSLTIAGNVDNSGFVDLENGSSLTVNGNANASGVGLLATSYHGGTGGNTLSVTGTLTITGATLVLGGHGDLATLGGLSNTGEAIADGGSTLQINGNATNSGSGILATDFLGGGGGNTLNVTGTLNNSAGFYLYSALDKSTIGGTVTNSLFFELLGAGSMATTGDLTNSGIVTVENGSTLQVNGNATNSPGAVIETNRFGHGGGNTLNVTGTLTNSSSFILKGLGDTSTIGSLTNNAGGFVDVEGGSTLTVTGNVTNSATGPQGIYTSFNGTGGNTINIGGTLTNNGMFGLESAGDIATVTGAVTNSGSFQITGAAAATFTSTLMNTGTVDLENASTLKINGTADNFGTLSTSANGGTGGNTLTVNGLLINEAGGQINLNGPSDDARVNNELDNHGSITVKNGSAIDPPFVTNLGTINIDGTSTFVVGTGSATGPGFIQLASGKFGEMINSATAFGVVNVAGSASLNGTLDILLQSGYNPTVGTSFTFLLLNPGQLTGTYATILNDIFNGGTEKWVVNYNDAGGFVSLTAASNTSTTPEPGTFLLLGSGLLSMAYGVRRRWLK